MHRGQAGVERVVVDKLGLRHSGGRFLVETHWWQLAGYVFSIQIFMFRHKNVHKCKHNQMFDLQSAEMGQMTIEPQKTLATVATYGVCLQKYQYNQHWEVGTLDGGYLFLVQKYKLKSCIESNSII